jgi:hypothetical protein
MHDCRDLRIGAKSSENIIKDIPVTLRTSAPTMTSFLSAENRTVPRVSITRNPLVRHSNRSFPATADVSGHETLGVNTSYDNARDILGLDCS